MAARCRSRISSTARGSLPAAWARVWGEPFGSAPLRRWCWWRMPAGSGPESLRSAPAAPLAASWSMGLQPGRPGVDLHGDLPGRSSRLRKLYGAALVVGPPTPRTRRRELTHIVTDVRPAGAVVDDPERARIVAEAASGTIAVVEPDLDVMAPGGAPGTRRRRARRVGPGCPRARRLHVGDDGGAQGGGVEPRQRAGQQRVGGAGVEVDPADRLVHALPVFHGHGLCVGLYTCSWWGPRPCSCRKFDVGGARCRRGARGLAVLRGADDVPPARRVAGRCPRVGAPAPGRVGVRRPARGAPSASWPGSGDGRARALRDDRDAHDALEPL